MIFTHKFQDLHHESLAVSQAIYQVFYVLSGHKLIERETTFGGRHLYTLRRELRIGERDLNFIPEKNLNFLYFLLYFVCFSSLFYLSRSRHVARFSRLFVDRRQVIVFDQCLTLMSILGWFNGQVRVYSIFISKILQNHHIAPKILELVKTLKRLQNIINRL